jgi:hypothetical protein
MNKDEINRAVHEALGLKLQHLCQEDEENICLCFENNPDYKPDDCLDLRWGRTWEDCQEKLLELPPAYTDDPRLFWPIAWDNNIHVEREVFNDDLGARAIVGGCLCGEFIPEFEAIDNTPGMAICLVFLKKKGVICE